MKNKTKCCSNSLKMLTVAFIESALSKLFTEGREDVNDDDRPAHPSTSTSDKNIDRVTTVVMENDRRSSFREVADNVVISVGSCHAVCLMFCEWNAPARMLLFVRNILAKNNNVIMFQPPKSANLAACGLFLFPNLKRPMKGPGFVTFKEIKKITKHTKTRLNFMPTKRPQNVNMDTCVLIQQKKKENSKMKCT